MTNRHDNCIQWMQDAIEVHMYMENDTRPTKGKHLEVIENAEYIIACLEKQKPKKPNKAVDTTWGIRKEVNVCPVCDYYLGNYAFINTKDILEKHKVTYCETCGQAIDWSKIE